MPSPILLHLLMKKYIIQVRHKNKSWKDYNSYKELRQAERTIKELKKINTNLEVRIYDRILGRVVGNFTNQK